MKKTIGFGFLFFILILSVMTIPFLSNTYKPLAAEQSITADEALTIAQESYADLDKLLMEAGTEHDWWGVQDIDLGVIQQDLEAIALDEIIGLFKNDAKYIFCACDAGVWVPVDETNRFQVNAFDEDKIEASFYQFSTATVQAGTTHLTFLKEDDSWKLASMDWDFNDINVTEAEVRAHIERMNQAQVEEVKQATVEGEPVFLYRFKDQTTYSAITMASGQPIQDVPVESLNESE